MFLKEHNVVEDSVHQLHPMGCCCQERRKAAALGARSWKPHRDKQPPLQGVSPFPKDLARAVLCRHAFSGLINEAGPGEGPSHLGSQESRQCRSPFSTCLPHAVRPSWCTPPLNYAHVCMCVCMCVLSPCQQTFPLWTPHLDVPVTQNASPIRRQGLGLKLNSSSLQQLRKSKRK